MPRTSKPAAPLTTAQQLASVVKAARDIMRKDKGPGMDTDLGRLPLLTWVMFLKFLDDLEMVREEEAKMAGERFRPLIAAPYRWRDWAANPAGMTGDEFLAFINDDKATRPDGTQGDGLFAYLEKLQSTNGGDRRDVVANVFRELSCNMRSGYLLREVVNRVNQINFASHEQLFTLGTLYESLLKEMRDAAGQNGEFYTPRPVVRFMVEVINPRLGETILDPACGTGGFLVEAYNHLKRQCHTVEDHKILQKRSLYGGEAKPLPYLLCEMNLLLHGLDYPQIDPLNSLRHPLREIGEKDRVDVILTNPPFGGEEEKGIQTNFPDDKRTSETALLFLQLIMRKLRRVPTPGRAAVVVPNGTLFGEGVCARIKDELLKDFNLHTIVRLPNGVFAPYTAIPTNLLFFDRAGPTREVWYYEHPLPEGRKSYSKTLPIQYDEFAPCLVWWHTREENERAWKVPAAEILATGCNLDRKNPHGKQDITHLPPEELVASILEKEKKIAEIMGRISTLFGSST